MHMRMGLFGRRSHAGRRSGGRPRYVSGLQRDIIRYEGSRREDVESDYRVSKTVHTIITLGYMEYVDDVLVLTCRGSLLVRNVPADAVPSD